MTSPETLAIPSWLQSLPRAPEYRPTESEFADPISFISRIEREAASFGICKIIPPFARPSKKFVFSNLNSSLAQSSNPSRDPSTPALITTRHQELGARKNGVGNQQVWQSGESYTLEQFESKARVFYRAHLSGVKEVRPLLVESLFWKAARDKPIYIEYANDVPGSGFPSRKGEMKSREPGWRLSESPWNLQVIARAHGSLTKFMPDDVPGVTSPMVYIGMLYSWFAWHIEDHELHSLNFLHTGASKTWYAVSSDHASQLEEIIRQKGYGGTIDRLASLGQLGEKTTLLSPEIIVASGVPCCRLVQNPGEFVVTFPRAYHVGFSHGFNCGEAANFATPQWLKFAKEAAVRRAAMNFLPMLSHQQLLYLLAISFISRNPNELLSGMRTSRLRDRKKEDRELIIKRAFLQDMVNENKLLCTLLLRKSTSNSVILWEPEMLPCSSTATYTLVKPNGDNCQMESSSSDEEDGLPFGLRVDSGSLTCVACGILGYPFMAILQPSEEALNNILSTRGEQFKKESAETQCSGLAHNNLTSTENLNSDDAGVEFSYSSSSEIERGEMLQTDRSNVSINGTSSSTKEPETERDSSERHSSFAMPSEAGPTNLSQEQVSEKAGRPRLFCLQHAVQIEELLQNRGGSHVLAICHADYLKIKALAISIAEETNIDFDYADINLEKASPSDMYIINISIDDEGYEEDGTNWTAKLGLNLKYCVKVRKEQPKNQNFNLALNLGSLFADEPLQAQTREPTRPDSSGVGVRWLSRKPRTPYKIVGTIVEGASLENWVNIAISTAESPQIDQIKGELNVCVDTSESVSMFTDELDASMSSAEIGVDIGVESATLEPVASSSMQIDAEVPDQSTPPHAVQCYARRVKRQDIEEEEKRDSFARSPCEGLRPRKAGPSLSEPLNVVIPPTVKKRPYVFKCENEGCNKRFRSRNEMDIHIRYRCLKRPDAGEFEMR
ncbi:Lysine-specific demethylase SE14 [Rhynchospora pubera]|uniref:Lysine-specific demethylase SE14 n=1 Tax=Rhynchospora pubera TaxID=906938 RepID=A0AAV8EHG7_9POAL|nr:Lysine-specific demethylase SE14 [Rhynchospora pubera]